MTEQLFLLEQRLREAHTRVRTLALHVDVLPDELDEDGGRVGDLITTAEESLREALELVEQEARVRRQVQEIGQ